MMLVIYGPTTAGKTNLAIILAKKYNGEIISVDSRQVYKGLDIGTGKVSPQSKIEKHQNYWVVDNIKIWGFDLVDPEEKFTVVDFIQFAESQVQALKTEGKLPILVGGTGFYIKSYLEGIPTIGITVNPKLRQSLQNLSASELFLQLQKINSQKASSLNQSDKANPRRLIRAIEIEQSATRQKKMIYKPVKNYQFIGLTAPNEYLFQKADKWLQQRLSIGMLEEIQKLITSGVNPKWLENLGLEYRWLTRYIQKEVTFDFAISGLKGDIHSYIRRQKTWFNQFPQMKLFNITKVEYQKKLEKSLNL